MQHTQLHVRSVNWRRAVTWNRFLTIGLLVLWLAISSTLTNTPLRLQPLLAKLAGEQPQRTVSVIVQKTIKDDRPEQQVAKLGGVVTKDLSIINAFTAELSANAAVELAKADGVKWVSLDAPTTSSADTCSTTLNASADTEIDEETPNASDGSATTIGTVPSPAGKRAYDLVQFNLSSLPAGSTILNATLGMYVQTARASAHSDSVHVMNTAWTEAATWNKRDGVNTWTSGAFGSNDYAATALGTIVPSTTGAKMLDVTSAVANWANGSVANRGFLIRSTGTDTGEVVYTAREATANKPYLLVSYSGTCTPPSTGFVTWANIIGTAIPNGFTSNALMIDSSLGANGAYGYGANVKGSFGGFVSEATPGTAITKVEAVLQLYVPAQLGSGEDPTLNVYVGGVAGNSIKIMHQAFDPYIGVANAGLLVVDITDSRVWQWANFDNNLELLIDQTKIKSTSKIYFDAIGLRVTSAPGADTTGDSGGDPSAVATVNTNALQNVYNQVIGAPQLWNNANRLQGKGITVAVVDSGVFKTKDLSKRVRVNANFNNGYHDAADRYGHGTFVAGLVAGSGSQSGNKYVGVAPRADVLNVRVSNDQGMSTESDVVSALQWVLANKAKYNTRVVNLSLNSSVAQSYHTSPLDAACEILWFNGIVVVASAGNNGTATLFPPANDPFVITVGATDDKSTTSLADDVVASFSAYGTTESGFAKPDLVAPGKNIIGLLPENNKLNMSMSRASNRIDNTYFKMSGTSMSAPIVAGAVALLLQDEPNLTPDQVKYRLMATANKSWAGYNAVTAGAGYLDIYAAVNGTTTQSANTGRTASQLLWSGSNPITWGSVDWNSVDWNSVDWNSVDWNSVNWNSVNWNSDYWEN